MNVSPWRHPTSLMTQGAVVAAGAHVRARKAHNTGNVRVWDDGTLGPVNVSSRRAGGAGTSRPAFCSTQKNRNSLTQIMDASLASSISSFRRFVRFAVCRLPSHSCLLLLELCDVVLRMRAGPACSCKRQADGFRTAEPIASV